VFTAFASCNENGNEVVKLVETITDIDGNYQKFEYDSQNRITKISKYDRDGNLFETKTLTYSGNDLVKYEFVVLTSEEWGAYWKEENNSISYTNSGIQIIKTSDGCKDTYKLNLNNDGYPAKFEGGGHCYLSSLYNYSIKNGNVTMITLESQGIGRVSVNYKYDDKKSPFTHTATPKWWIILNIIEMIDNRTEAFYGNNNIIEILNDKGEVLYECIYEYDSDGYPITRKAKHRDRILATYQYKVN